MNRAITFVRGHIGIIIVCSIFFGAGLLRLNDLSLLNPDSTRYLIFGNSLAHGHGFVDETQPDPDRYSVQGPLYPILLAPIEAMFPLSLTAAKVWTLCWGVLAIALFYAWLKRRLGTTSALVGSILVVVNPLTFVYSTEVLAESPFLAFVLLVILLVEHLTPENSNRRPIMMGIILSVLAVTLLRDIGVAMVAACSAYFLRQKKFGFAATTIVSALVLMTLWYLRNNFWIATVSPSWHGNFTLITQHFVTPPETSLADELVARVWINLKEYFMQISGMLIYPLFLAKQFRLDMDPSAFHESITIVMKSVGKFAVLAVGLPAMIAGVIQDFRRYRSAFLRILFALFYIGVMFLYPVHDIRFLLPLLPLMIYYGAFGIKAFLAKVRFPQRLTQPSIAVIGAIVLMVPNLSADYEILKINLAYNSSPVAFYERVQKLPVYPVMFTQPWSLIGDWIRKNLPDNVVIASPSKELAVVVGDRKVLVIEQNALLPAFERTLRDNHIEYLLTTARLRSFRVFDFLMEESHRFTFEPIYRVANLHLLRVRSRLQERILSNTIAPVNPDSTDAMYYLRFGRAEMMNEQYGAARSYFRQALTRDSLLPEIYYQMITACALDGDLTSARLWYRKLFALPQALGYVGNARLQLNAAEMVAKARAQKFVASRSVQVFQAASLYWKIGYPRRAARLMNDMLSEDTTYFVGLLWGLHFNLQLGDTERAKTYLRVLENIDRNNAVVKAFDRILLIEDSIGAERDPFRRSKMHITIAALYKKIELNEEAIDETERALADDPNNVDALTLMAQVFEAKGKRQRALDLYHQAVQRDPQNTVALARIDSLQR